MCVGGSLPIYLSVLYLLPCSFKKFTQMDHFDPFTHSFPALANLFIQSC